MRKLLELLWSPSELWGPFSFSSCPQVLPSTQPGLSTLLTISALSTLSISSTLSLRAATYFSLSSNPSNSSSADWEGGNGGDQQNRWFGKLCRFCRLNRLCSKTGGYYANAICANNDDNGQGAYDWMNMMTWQSIWSKTGLLNLLWYYVGYQSFFSLAHFLVIHWR